MAHKNHVTPLNGKEYTKDLEFGGPKISRPDSSVTRREKKTEIVIKERKEKADKFDAFYKQLGHRVIPEDKRIDYVLVNPKINMKEIEDEDERKDIERQIELREKFEFAMHEEGLMKQKVEIDDNVYTKLHCPFRRLCEEAEAVSLEMPLIGVSKYLMFCCLFGLKLLNILISCTSQMSWVHIILVELNFFQL